MSEHFSKIKSSNASVGITLVYLTDSWHETNTAICLNLLLLYSLFIQLHELMSEMVVYAVGKM